MRGRVVWTVQSIGVMFWMLLEISPGEVAASRESGKCSTYAYWSLCWTLLLVDCKTIAMRVHMFVCVLLGVHRGVGGACVFFAVLTHRHPPRGPDNDPKQYVRSAWRLCLLITTMCCCMHNIFHSSTHQLNYISTRRLLHSADVSS